MKKLTALIFCFSVLIFNSFSQKLSFDYQLNEDSQGYDFFLNKKGFYEKDSIVSIDKLLQMGEDDPEFLFIYFARTPDQVYFPLKILKNPNVTCDFSEFFAGISQDAFLVPDYVVTALSKRNRDYIMKFDKNTSRLNEQDGEWIFTWYQYVMETQCISECLLSLGTAYSQDVFFVQNVKKFGDNKVEIDAVVKKEEESKVITDIFSDLSHGQNVLLRLEKDGDYLKLYIGNEAKPRQVYCYVDFETMNQLNTFIYYDFCNYKKVTWPRHADGSCEY